MWLGGGMRELQNSSCLSRTEPDGTSLIGPLVDDHDRAEGMGSALLADRAHKQTLEAAAPT